MYPHIGIDKRVTAAESDIPGSLKVVIYRIVQEAFNNVVKHADADRVALELSADAGRIRLSVRDNGRGFELQENNGNGAPKGIGLQSMRERAEWSGGALRIDSRKRTGTTIEALWEPPPRFASRR